MHKVIIIAVAGLSLAACQTPQQTAGTAAGATAGAVVAGPVGAVVGGTVGAAATAPEQNAFVGTWTGTTARGGAVQVVVPATGTPTYAFRGERVPVRSAAVSGNTLVLGVGATGEGRVVLTPVGAGQLRYDYSFRGQSASAVLARA